MAAFRSGANAWTIPRVEAIIPILAELAARPARFLFGGEQQMLKFSRCLLANPRLLLLDEPTEGSALQVMQQVIETLRTLRSAAAPACRCS